MYVCYSLAKSGQEGTYGLSGSTQGEPPCLRVVYMFSTLSFVHFHEFSLTFLISRTLLFCGHSRALSSTIDWSGWSVMV